MFYDVLQWYKHEILCIITQFKLNILLKKIEVTSWYQFFIFFVHLFRFFSPKEYKNFKNVNVINVCVKIKRLISEHALQTSGKKTNPCSNISIHSNQSRNTVARVRPARPADGACKMRNLIVNRIATQRRKNVSRTLHACGEQEGGSRFLKSCRGDLVSFAKR